MGLGDLTLLLVGRDSLAQQLHVHLEHRGADIERTEANEALDAIRVAVPDLIILSQDAAASDGERIRDALMTAGKPPRVLALCDKKLGAKIATYKHDFVAALENDAGAELIASCIESLCGLMGKSSSASRPLRSLVADVRRSHMPSKPISPSKQTLAGTAPLVVPPAAVAVVAPAPAQPIAAPKPAAKPIEVPKPAALVETKPVEVKPVEVKPVEAKPVEAKPITSVAPIRTSQPMPLAAFLNAPPSAVVISTPPSPRVSAAPVAAVSAKPPAPASAPPVIISEPESFDELDISVTSVPPPPLSLSPSPPSPAQPIASMPSPTPLFVETQTQTPAPSAPPPNLRPSPMATARALALRFKSLTRNQQYAAAAVVLLAFVIATVVSVSGGEDEAPIAQHASASLSNVAHQAQKQSTPPKPTPLLGATPPPAAKPEPAPVLTATAPQTAPTAVANASDDDAPEDSMVDGELYDPHADPARAKANYLVNMGHRLRKQGRWGMAEASYLKALKAMPNYGRAVSGLVAVHLGRRDAVEAQRWAKKLVDLQPKRGAHQRLLGDAYALGGNKAAARAAWQLGARLGDRTSRQRMQ